MIKVIGIDEDRIKGHHDRRVRASVEETPKCHAGRRDRPLFIAGMIDDFAKSGGFVANCRLTSAAD
jgi:hypothetical protein